MQAKFIRRIYFDEWIAVQGTPFTLALRKPESFCSAFVRMIPGTPYGFVNYALGFKCEADESEMELIRTNNLLSQPFISLHKEDPPISFAEALGPEWIAEINPEQQVLLQVECRMREAAAMWTHFLESMRADD